MVQPSSEKELQAHIALYFYSVVFVAMKIDQLRLRIEEGKLIIRISLVLDHCQSSVCIFSANAKCIMTSNVAMIGNKTYSLKQKVAEALNRITKTGSSQKGKEVDNTRFTVLVSTRCPQENDDNIDDNSCCEFQLEEVLLQVLYHGH